MSKPITDAYSLVSRLTYTGLNAVAQGITPAPGNGWPDGQPVLALHMKAAMEFMSAGTKGSAKEINDRLEGPVEQKLNIGGTFNVVSAIGPPAAAQPQLPPTRDVN